MSSPNGADTRASASRETPLPIRSSKISLILRRLPIIPTYLADVSARLLAVAEKPEGFAWPPDFGFESDGGINAYATFVRKDGQGDKRYPVIRVTEGMMAKVIQGDADKLATAFHPTSALTSLTDGKLSVLPRDTWLDWVRNRPSSKSKGLARGDEILSIDIAGPAMAFVKLKCQIPPRYFTDQLSLLKIDGHWQIAQKVFQTETR